MGIWWYDRHMPTAQPRLRGRRELRQSVADGGRALPLATAQHCQGSESISPGLEGEGSLRGRDGGRSQNSKLHAQQA